MIARILSWLLRRSEPRLRPDYVQPDRDRLTVALRGDGTASRDYGDER